jgi:hypothetical protein
VPLLALDQQQALAREDEEVLLIRLAVVEPARHARLKDAERVADLAERRRAVAFERAARAERVVRHPGCVAHVHDEPALGDRGQSGGQLLETRFLRHSGSAAVCTRS